MSISDIEDKLRYYPVTLFRTAAEVLAASKTLNYRLDSDSSDCKSSRIFGFRVCRREKSSFSAMIALIRRGLHFVEWLYKQ